jgi:cytochrome c oxidase assembly factor CtaG
MSASRTSSDRPRPTCTERPRTPGVPSTDVVPVVVAVVLLLGYGGGLRAVRRRGQSWPWWRTGCFVLLGLGSILGATLPFETAQRHHLWAVAVSMTLLLSISPVFLALGDPVGLARTALSPAGAQRLERVLHGRVVQLLTFPVVAAVLATAVLTATFFSPLLGAAVRHGWVMDLVYLLMLVVGCLAALPMLGAEILPAWVTDPVKLVFAFVDGVFDALPGILVMTTSTKLAGGFYLGRASDPNWDAHVAGAAMLALTEVVALPMFFLVFFRWAGSEIRRRPEPDDDEPLLSKPWWEQ